MSTIALNTASTGLNALSTSLDVTANNLANVNTVGFKASSTDFEDLFYLTQAQPGYEDSYGNSQPTGLQVGLGVQVSGTSLDVSQGSFETSSSPYSLAIQGDGWFQIEIPEGLSPDGYGYIVTSYHLGLGSSSSTLYISEVSHILCHFSSISS